MVRVQVDFIAYFRYSCMASREYNGFLNYFLEMKYMGENTTGMRFMTRDAIKYLAIVAMTLDHIAYIFLEPHTLLYRLFLCIGTFTGPVMLYFLIEGYFYTHDIRGYAKRLLLFALLSQLPFSLAIGGFFGNMLFTLLICLGVLYVHDHVVDGGVRNILYTLLFFASLFTDWNFLSVPLVLFLRPAFHPAVPIVERSADQYQNEENILMKSQAKAQHFYIDPAEQRRGMLKCVAYFIVVSCLTKGMIDGMTEVLGMVLGFVCIACFYNGQQAKTHQKFHKYFFYIYYPVHLLVLWTLHAM